jgi:hypothetical protein
MSFFFEFFLSGKKKAKKKIKCGRKFVLVFLTYSLVLVYYFSYCLCFHGCKGIHIHIQIVPLYVILVHYFYSLVYYVSLHNKKKFKKKRTKKKEKKRGKKK